MPVKIYDAGGQLLATMHNEHGTRLARVDLAGAEPGWGRAESHILQPRSLPNLHSPEPQSCLKADRSKVGNFSRTACSRGFRFPKMRGDRAAQDASAEPSSCGRSS